MSFLFSWSCGKLIILETNQSMQINQQILVAHLVNGINPVILAENGWFVRKKIIHGWEKCFPRVSFLATNRCSCRFRGEFRSSLRSRKIPSLSLQDATSSRKDNLGNPQRLTKKSCILFCSFYNAFDKWFSTRLASRLVGNICWNILNWCSKGICVLN